MPPPAPASPLLGVGPRTQRAWAVARTPTLHTALKASAVPCAQVDTIGRNAFDKFNITYHGEALTEPMCQLTVNALQYYLSM